MWICQKTTGLRAIPPCFRGMQAGGVSSASVGAALFLKPLTALSPLGHATWRPAAMRDLNLGTFPAGSRQRLLEKRGPCAPGKLITLRINAALLKAAPTWYADLITLTPSEKKGLRLRTGALHDHHLVRFDCKDLSSGHTLAPSGQPGCENRSTAARRSEMMEGTSLQHRNRSARAATFQPGKLEAACCQSPGPCFSARLELAPDSCRIPAESSEFSAANDPPGV